MTVEIRELIIKTEIKTESNQPTQKLSQTDLMLLKRQIIGECRRNLIGRTHKQSVFNR